jgi:elongation factor 1 alpha-like protein
MKNVSVADEDYVDQDTAFNDEYEDEDAAGDDGLTEEDRESLRVGTVEVRNALGPGYSFISEKDIQDALWHYYYDVAKSVSYLKSGCNVPLDAGFANPPRQTKPQAKQARQETSRKRT